MLKNVVYRTKQKIRFVQFRCAGNGLKPVIDREFTPEQAASETASDAAALKEFLRREGLGKFRSVLSCLFRYQSGVRFFSFPTHDDKEISRMVQYESAEILPLKPEEVITRGHILARNADGYSDVLVAVTPREETAGMAAYFHAAGLQVNVLTLSSLALLACLKNTPQIRESAPEDKNIMLVYCEDEVVEVMVVCRGMLAVSRGFTIANADTCAQSVTAEIRHSMELFRDKTKEERIDNIILGGRGALTEKTGEAVRGAFALPWQFIPELDIAYGIAAPEAGAVNMLEDELIAGRKKARLKKKIMLAAALTALNFVLAAVLLMISLEQKKRYAAYLQQRLEELKPRAKLVQDKFLKMQLLTSQVDTQMLILDALADLVRAAPAGCSLNMLTINESGMLVVRGQAANLQEVLDYVAGLEKSEHLSGSHLNYSSRRKVETREVVDFEIQSVLKRENRPSG